MDDALDRLKKLAEEQAERDKKNRPACENCGWFAAAGDQKIGDCHRYPPTLDTVGDEEWKHARTSRDNVCGEFVHKRTGEGFRTDPYRAVRAHVARLEDEIDRLRKVAAE